MQPVEPMPHVGGMSDAVVAAAKSIFAGMGVQAVDADDGAFADAGADDPGAVIGFAGSQAAGTLSLRVPWRVLHSTYPCALGSEEDLLDWLREISNLVLGGIKQAFLERGIVFEIGCPSSSIAPHAPIDTAERTAMVHVLEVDCAKAVILFDAIVTPDAKWGDDPKPESEDCAPSSEILFL